MPLPDYSTYHLARVGIARIARSMEDLPLWLLRQTIDIHEVGEDEISATVLVLFDATNPNVEAEIRRWGPLATVHSFGDGSEGMADPLVFREPTLGRATIVMSDPAGINGGHLVLVPTGSPFAHRFGAPL